MSDATNPYDALSDHLHGQGAPASDTGDNAMTEMKPCPFCGCTTIKKRVNEDGTRWHECGWCTATGPAEQPDEDPPLGWNTRADLTRPQAVAVEVKPLAYMAGEKRAEDRLRPENERLRAALRHISSNGHEITYCRDGHEESVLIARAALKEEADE